MKKIEREPYEELDGYGPYGFSPDCDADFEDGYVDPDATCRESKKVRQRNRPSMCRD